MRLDILLDFGYCYSVIWHKCSLSPVLESDLQLSVVRLFWSIPTQAGLTLQELQANFPQIHPSGEIWAAPWMVPKFSPDNLVMWEVHRSSLNPPGLLLDTSGPLWSFSNVFDFYTLKSGYLRQDGSERDVLSRKGVNILVPVAKVR